MGADEGTAVGVAVVGTGFGVLTHVPALRAAGFDVRALVGRDPEKTAERASRFGIALAATSLAEALADPGIAAVTIATPPATHAAIALEAIAAGRHVLCEKPFARDLDEARTVFAAAESAGIVHLLGTEFRWDTGQALMARGIADGLIGEPRLATFLLHIPLLAGPTAEVPGWWSDAELGGGWLGAHASHVIDQVRSTLGEFAGVSAGLLRLADRGERDWTAEDTYTVHFRLENGVEGIMQGTAADWGPLTITSRIAGTKGTIWAEGPTVRVADASGTRVIDVPDDLVLAAPVSPPADLLVTEYDLLHSMGTDLAPYTRLAETFRALIQGRDIPADPRPATFADGVATIAVTDAIRRAAADHTWISIPRT